MKMIVKSTLTTNQTDIQSDRMYTPCHMKCQMIYFDDQPNAIFPLNVQNLFDHNSFSNVS